MKSTRGSLGWFLLPWALGFTVLTLIPVLYLLIVSMTGISKDSPAQDRTWDRTWVGLDHYRAMLAVDHTYAPSDTDPWYWHVLSGRPRDARLYKSLHNSLIYTFLAVPLGLASSLAVALLLHGIRRGGSIVRACVYLPHVLGGVATIVIWSWMLNPVFGWVNEMIGWSYAFLDPLVRLVGGSGTTAWPVPDWLYSPTWCIPAVVWIHVWSMGASMLIFLAALRRVPSRLHDAALLDGAGRWHRFRHVTLPQITPALLFNLIVGVVFAMQSFNESYLLRNRRQEDGLLFYVVYLYETAFESPHQFGYASSMALALLAILAMLVTPILLTSRRWVHYGDKT